MKRYAEIKSVTSIDGPIVTLVMVEGAEPDAWHTTVLVRETDGSAWKPGAPFHAGWRSYAEGLRALRVHPIGHERMPNPGERLLVEVLPTSARDEPSVMGGAASVDGRVGGSAEEPTAVLRAREDWDAQRSRYQCFGALALDRPLLSKEQPFYPVSSGCQVTPERIEYCRIYNETLDALVAERGVPDWAPAKRLPGRTEALELLERDGTNRSDLVRVTGVSRIGEWIEVVRSRRGATTKLWAVVPERDLVLVGGDLSERAGLVDVVDARDGAYMASYEYRRRHAPKLPWDGVQTALPDV